MAFGKVDWIFLQGKGKWCQRLFAPDSAFGDPNWNFVLYPNEESLEKVKALKTNEGKNSGILNHLKKDEDGYYLQLKRPCTKNMKGKLVSFEPPLIMQSDGKTPWDREKAIGNGSDVTAKLECYGYPKPAGGFGKAIRLYSVRVDNLVEYVKDRDLSEEQLKAAKGLDEQPEQLF
jgi:hypothetical protein